MVAVRERGEARQAMIKHTGDRGGRSFFLHCISSYEYPIRVSLI